MKMRILWCSVFVAFAITTLIACGGGTSNPTDDVGFTDDIPYLQDVNKDTVTSSETTGSGHAPVLSKIGDRIVAVGEKLTIVLAASDSAGDSLTYSVYGDIPDGALFDKANNTFTWVPLQADQIVYLTFVVSDGASLDRETVEIKVVAEKAGHPPVFELISDQKVSIGTAVKLQLEALDSDGDALTFSILGAKPAEAAINPSTGEFTWTPAAAQDNSVVKLMFSVADGVFDDTMEVQFLVGDVGSPPTFTAIAPKTVAVGAELRFTVSATDPDGEEVTYSVQGGMPQTAVFDPGVGLFIWTPLATDDGRTYEILFGATDGVFSSYGSVKVSVSTSGQTTCSNDQFETNNDSDHATLLDDGTYSLSICDTEDSPVDEDWFGIAMKSGDTVTVVLSFIHNQGDIDCDLSLDGSEETIVATSNSTSNEERIQFTADEDWHYILAVYGVGDTTYSNPYEMTVTITEAPPACEDDTFEENDSIAAAKAILGTETGLSQLVLCSGDEDYFSINLKAGDSILASATPKSGSVGISLIGPDKTTVLDSTAQTTGSSIVMAEQATAGTYYLRLQSTGTAKYSLELLIESATPGCTSTSCSKGMYCNTTTGSCVTESCTSSGECASGASCIDKHCILSCDDDSECRSAYKCKTFPSGKFCAEYDTKTTGKACTTFLKCAGERICLFQEYGGYCAEYGCTDSSDCDDDAACVNDSGMYYCAAICTGTCPNELFDCKSKLTADGFELDVCLP